MDFPLSLPLETTELSIHSAISCSSNSKRQYQKRSVDKIRRWSIEECQKYEDFILNNEELMNGSNSNRATKIFLMMSEHIATKTPTQCRSHHQKFFRRVMKKKFAGYPSSETSPRELWLSKKKLKVESQPIKVYPEPENNFLSGTSMETNNSNDEGGWPKLEEGHSIRNLEKYNMETPNLNILSRSDSQMYVDWLGVLAKAHKKNTFFADFMYEDEDLILS